ncbi:MAG: stress-induced protein [Deltaproteobacteria bacterium]|nr:stress-induced protein [Deltaproteobacteria bacterium]
MLGEKLTSKRGFASMDPEKQKEIARRGGKAAHAKGRAHEFTPDEAKEAGRKGGRARRVRPIEMRSLTEAPASEIPMSHGGDEDNREREQEIQKQAS